MTIQQVRDNFVLNLAENAYLNMCTTEEMLLAISALEKQILKKPFNKSNNQENWKIMCCPTCERVFWNSGNWLHYKPTFCEKCGQALDWSDTK